jgi:2-keto-4-pentenoate hydratase
VESKILLQKQITAAARAILDYRLSGCNSCQLPNSFRPQAIEDALEIQSEMLRLNPGNIGGWKCGVPSDDGSVVVAPIFSQTIYNGQSCFLFPDRGFARIEPEIGFLLKEDLLASNGPYTNEQILGKIAGTYLALELIQDRFVESNDASFIDKLADCLGNQGLFIGPEIDRLSVCEGQPIEINIRQPDFEGNYLGSHPNKHPQTALFWLVNYMCARGVSFRAGQFIITGSYCGVIDLQFDVLTNLEYRRLGRCSVEFKDMKFLSSSEALM